MQTKPAHGWIRGSRLIVVFAAIALTPSVGDALPDHVVAFPASPHTPLTPVQEDFVTHLEDDPEATHVEINSIDAIPYPEDLATFDINVPSLGQVQLEAVDSKDLGGGMHLWRGRDVDEGAEGTLVIRGEFVVGTIRAPGVVASLRPLGGDLHVLVVWDPGGQTLCDVGMERPGPKPTPTPDWMPPPTPCPTAPDAATQVTEIWIVVGYTETAKERAAVPPQTIEQVIVEAVEAANLAYQESGLSLKLVRKHTFPVTTFDECCTNLGDNCLPVRDVDQLALLAPTTGLQVVHDVRDLYAADVAVLFTAYESCGGRAPIPDCPYDPANEAMAFAIVPQKWATSLFSLAHEIGHIQSAWHNPERLIYSTRTPAIPYSHGKCNQTISTAHPNGWNTIMSYNSDADGNVLCKEYIGRVANPNVDYPPFPTPAGVATGDVTTHDVARVFEETAFTVGSYRVPASVTLHPANFVLRKGKTIQIQATVSRDGAPVQNATIRFSSLDTGVAPLISSSSSTDSSGHAVALVKGLSSGDALVTALSAGGTAIAQIHVKIAFWEAVALILIAVAVAIIALYRYYQSQQPANR